MRLKPLSTRHRAGPLLSAAAIALAANASSAALRADYAVEMEGTYDSNVPQNITEYAGWYGSPQLYLKLSSSGSGLPLAVWGRLTYENYIKERSAILNSPFSTGGLRLNVDGKVLSFDLEVQGALYYSERWQLAKLRYGPEARLRQRLDRHVISQRAKVYRYNYGDNSDDCWRSTGSIGYVYDFRVLKSQNIMVREAGVQAEGEYSDARSDTSTYLLLNGQVGGALKLWAVDLDLSGGYKYRRYYGLKQLPEDGTTVYPENTYVTVDGKLSFPIWRDLSGYVRGVLRFKNSTYAPYDYDRYTAHAGLRWRSSVELFGSR
jgi:hypothetical protein